VDFILAAWYGMWSRKRARAIMDRIPSITGNNVDAGDFDLEFLLFRVVFFRVRENEQLLILPESLHTSYVRRTLSIGYLPGTVRRLLDFYVIDLSHQNDS
jgi:hypothetical protein